MVQASETMLQDAIHMIPAEISSEDVFVDIARFSGGKSTMLLLSKGVTRQKVESMVEELEWELIERDSYSVD